MSQNTSIFLKMSETKSIKPTLRDSRGFLSSVNYILNKDGTINWRAMVNPAHLYPNKDWFERRNRPVPEAYTPDLRDEQLLIKLGGIKEVAKLRGYNRISFDFPKLEKDYVVATCTIDWIINQESTNPIVGDDAWESLTTMDVANATYDNTDGFGQKFLETIAANRAFVRTVRNFLGIHIVGEDEISKKPITAASSSSNSDVSPQAILEKKFAASNEGSEFSDFKNWLRQLWVDETYRNEDAKNWKSWSDVPAKEARTLIKQLAKSE